MSYNDNNANARVRFGGQHLPSGANATAEQRRADLEARANRVVRTENHGMYVSYETESGRRTYKPQSLFEMSMYTCAVLLKPPARQGRRYNVIQSPPPNAAFVRRAERSRLPQQLVDRIVRRFVDEEMTRQRYDPANKQRSETVFRAAMPLLRYNTVTNLHYRLPVPTAHLRRLNNQAHVRSLHCVATTRAELPAYIGTLRVLKLRATETTDVLLLAICAECPLLEELELELSNRITCNSKRKGAGQPDVMRFPKLRVLKLRSMTRLSNVGLAQLTRATPELREVHIADCPEIGYLGLSVLIGTHSCVYNDGALEHVSVTGSGMDTVKEDEWVELLNMIIKHTYAHLRVLELEHSAQYQPSMLTRLLDRAKELERLKLSTRSITQAAVTALLQSNDGKYEHVAFELMAPGYRRYRRYRHY